jgi:hypothetical protein
MNGPIGRISRGRARLNGLKKELQRRKDPLPRRNELLRGDEPYLKIALELFFRNS